ncbi:MAG: type III-B CRISPR module RAMP protein Cmr4 [Desulfobacterales bacterium]|nr:MAG: type III-B CRISPR module RAMP protein Cmr4 [Desulfobacterales bacterium]
MKMQIYFMQTRSGLHCGIGQGLSDIDQPVARHSITGHPLVPGTTIKGVLREYFEECNEQELFAAAFGGLKKGESDFASALAFTDSQLITLPARSYYGTYAHVSTPQILHFVKDEMIRAGFKDLPEIPQFPLSQETSEYHAAVSKNSRLLRGKTKTLLLEELDLLVDVLSSKETDKWGELLAKQLFPDDTEGQKFFKEGFVLVDNDVLDFLCETALPVAAHNRINENGIVEDGALWYEEYVPAEAVFLGAIYAENARGKGYNHISAEDLLKKFCHHSLFLQIGGNATTGRGLVSITFSLKGDADAE